jgi:uncharacterized membrane protein
MNKIFLVILANLLPVSEQLGGIPLGLSLGLDPLTTLFVSLLVNVSLFFPVYFALKFFYTAFLSKIKIFNLYLRRVWKKGKPYVDKYGVIGLTLFICLPSPLTGTYTGTILAWLLGLDWKKAFLAIFLGSLIGGVIILSSALGFLRIVFPAIKK